MAPTTRVTSAHIMPTCEEEEDELAKDLFSCIGGLTWEILGSQLQWSIIAWAGLVVVCYSGTPFRLWLQLGCRRRKGDSLAMAWKMKWFGDGETLPLKPHFDAILRSLQGMCSCVTVVLWVTKTYKRAVPGWLHGIDCGCCVVYLAHLLSALIRSNFAPAYAWGWEAAIDAFTVPPLILERSGGNLGGAWLTLAFLRVLRVRTAFMRLAKSGVFETLMTETGIAVMIKILEFVSVIIIMAGSLLIIESLGDIPGFADSFFLTDLGDEISFVQMCYL